jgi:hypothetical protein
MSSTLYFYPKTNGKELPDELKHALHNLDQFGQAIDGTYDESIVPVLRGIEAAGVKGARKLIDAIEKYGEVELKEEY